MLKNKSAEEVLNSNNSKTAKTVIIVVVVIIVLVGISVGIYIYIENEKKKAKLKWPEDRCSNQLYMNYPSTFGPPGMTYAQNKAFCDAAAMNAAAKKNNAPLQNQLNQQNRTMAKFNNHIKRK